MRPLRHAAGLCWLLCLFPLVPAIATDERPGAGLAFERLGGLVGTWTAPATDHRQIRVTYRLISAGTALVESYSTASGKETLTVFHLDGPRLLATHYCAQGNQPRLRLTSRPGARTLVFEFLDATNLGSPQAAHLERLELVLADAGHVTRSETYREGSTLDTQRLELTRAGPQAGPSPSAPRP